MFSRSLFRTKKSNNTEKEEILKKFKSNISLIQQNKTSFEKLIYLILLTDDYDNLIKFTKGYKEKFPAYILTTAFFFCKKVCILRYFLCSNTIEFIDNPAEEIISLFRNEPKKNIVNGFTLNFIKENFKFLEKFIEENRLTNDNKYDIFKKCYENIEALYELGDLKCTQNTCGIKKQMQN